MFDHISAVTFAVREMARAVNFYQQIGLPVIYGGPEAHFTSLQYGQGYINLIVTPDYVPTWTGRTILRVSDVDALHRHLTAQGLSAPPPRDATWGERYFHVTDPDGHELSFAEILPTKTP